MTKCQTALRNKYYFMVDMGMSEAIKAKLKSIVDEYLQIHHTLTEINRRHEDLRVRKAALTETLLRVTIKSKINQLKTSTHILYLYPKKIVVHPRPTP
ncbi:TPA_asm: hypothetical protein [Synchytrium chytrid fungus MELD element]|nr:TPA_asm: hypothetical protein [Synchytrium chytrid fungus MELD element]